MYCQRHRAALHLGGALVTFLVTGMGLACCTPRPACYAGLPDRVAEHCGCSPPQQRVEAVLAQTGLPDAVRDRLHKCWTANVAGSAGAAAKSLSELSAAVKACVEHEQTLNTEVRNALVQVLDDARHESKDPGEQARVSTWQICFANNTQ
jgi:hypothetical protein